MFSYESLKLAHTIFALSSIAGFLLRGYWMMISHPLLSRRLSRILPHLVDTLLLISAAALLFKLQLSPLSTPWLTAKLIALLLYILLGLVALRFGRNLPQRITAYVLALLTAVYIVIVAITKSPWGVLA